MPYCSRCGQQYPDGAVQCQRCGAVFVTQYAQPAYYPPKVQLVKQKTSGLTMGCAWLFGISLVVMIITGIARNCSSGDQTGVQTSNQKVQEELRRFAKSATPADHLRQAQILLRRDQVNGLARQHLQAIPSSAPEFQEANRLLSQISTVESRRNAIALRKQYARVFEESCLNNNLDATITTHGETDEKLRIRCVLAGRVWGHKLSQNGEFWNKVKTLGFTEVTLTDGYDYSVSWDVTK